MAYSYAQLEQFAIQGGFPASLAPTMAAIAMAESSGSNVIQKGQPYSTTGYGLWQITPGNSEPQFGVNNALLDPVANAKAAFAKYKSQGLGAWTTYTSGAYKQFLQGNVPPASGGNVSGGNMPNDTGNILGDQGQGPGGLGQPNIGGDTGNILSEGQAPDQQGGQSWWQWFENQIPGVSDFHAMAQGLGGIASDLGDVGKAFVWLSSGKHWVRIFAGIAGTVMVFVGLMILHSEVKNG